MAKKRRMKYLSESMLLEERGLPRVNVIITLLVTLILVSFIVWSSLVVVEEAVSFKGQVLEGVINNNMMLGKVAPADISELSLEDLVYVSVPGVTSREKIKGRIINIDSSPQYTSDDQVYYHVVVRMDKNHDGVRDLLVGMTGSISAVTEEKSLLQYLLGNLYESGKSAFSGE